MSDPLDRARQHLLVIGGAPRPAGGAADTAARRHAAVALAAAGFSTREVPFTYSALPGRYGTPLFGAAAIGTIAAAGHVGARGGGGFALLILLAGAVVLGLVGRWLARDGVLDLGLMRAGGVNLVATRGREPQVWLVAHTDSKSQPIPQALRAAGITALALTWLGAMLLAAAQHLATLEVSFATWAAVAGIAAVAGAPVVLSVVGTASDGALDNASGVAAVLLAAERLPRELPAGVLITTAEELGLAGARAWARTETGAGRIALNCDGVDDAGMLTGMHSGRSGGRAIEARAGAARELGTRFRSTRLIPGILVDAVALDGAGWDAATLSRGTLATLARVHTRRDTLAALQGTGIPEAAAVLAVAAERLATRGMR